MKLEKIRQSIRLFRHFFAAYPVRSTGVLLALTTAALAEGVGIAALLPLITLIIDSNSAGGTFTLYAEQVFALIGQDLSLGGLLVFIVLAITLKSLLLLVSMAQVGYTAAHVTMDLRLAFIRALLNASWAHFVDQRTGDLASAISVEPMRVAVTFVSCCRVLAGAIQLLVYLALAVTISWEVAVVAIVVGAVGIVVLGHLVSIARQAGQSQTELQKSFMTRLLQGLDGMKPLKAMAREGSMGPLIEADTRGLNYAQRMIVFSGEALTQSHEIIRACAVAGGLYVLVATWSQPVDGLLVLALLFLRTLQNVSQLHKYYHGIAVNLPAFAFLRSTITAAEEAREPGLGGTVPRLASAISLRDVSFSYGRENVLGERLDDAAGRCVHRRRRHLGCRQDDRRRPHHRVVAAPARRGLD